QAEDGIRDGHVTGVQTCALPIYRGPCVRAGSLPTGFAGEQAPGVSGNGLGVRPRTAQAVLCFDYESQRNTRSIARDKDPTMGRKIGRASCREREERWVGDGGV